MTNTFTGDTKSAVNFLRCLDLGDKQSPMWPHNRRVVEIKEVGLRDPEYIPKWENRNQRRKEQGKARRKAFRI